jgi:glycosyltransferase involved in cell wall biosynthesis
MIESKLTLRIAIDLTPLRPGGENGGAKILILTLLKRLQQLAPDYSFLLLTAPWNHEELTFYENKNTKCLLLSNLAPEPHKLEIHTRVHYKILSFILRKLKSKLGNFIYYNKSFLRSHKVDLLFCPFSAPTYAEKDIPLVAIGYDLQHLDYSFFFDSHEKEHRTSFLKNLIQKSQQVICISEFTRQSFIKHFNAPESQFSVVPISIQDRWSKLSEKIVIKHLHQLGLKNCSYAFYPANYWSHKNHRMLLAAYGMYRHQFPNQPLDLVFTGTLEAEETQLREAVVAMGLSEEVHFLGFLEEEVLGAVWQGCKCLVFPSLYEGFGIPVLEAMAFGKPVLCSNVGSLPEVGGDAVLYFDPRKPDELVSCLAKISSDTALVNELVNKGYQRLQLFEGEQMAKEYLKIFETVVFNRGQSSQTSITGVYNDCWSEPEFHISVKADSVEQTLILVVQTPAFYPASKARIKVKEKNRKYIYYCRRGESKEIVCPISPTGEMFTIQITPSFKPSKLGLNADQRQLGLLVHDCRVRLADGTSRSIFTSESIT